MICIPSTLSFGLLSGVKLFDKTIFDLLDFTTSNLLLPFNTLLICLISGWFINSFTREITENLILKNVFSILLKFIVPFILLLVLIYGLK